MNGIFLMLCSDVAFAVMAAAAKLAGSAVPACQVIFVRSLFSTAALFLYLKKRRISLKGGEPGLLWARGIIGYVALQCYFSAIPHLPLGTAVMLNYTAPIFAVALSVLLLRERPPLAVALLLVTSFAGVYLVASPKAGGDPLSL